MELGLDVMYEPEIMGLQASGLARNPSKSTVLESNVILLRTNSPESNYGFRSVLPSQAAHRSSE
jgi:hypothetical protein